MTDRLTTPAAPGLADRYGRTPDRRRRGRAVAVLAAVALVVATIAWAVWTGVGGATTAVDVQTQAFTINGDRTVSVTWLVSGRADHRLVCAIEAQAEDDTVVGLVEIEVPVTGSDDRTGATTVRITRAATTGLIQSCRDA